MLIDRFLPEYQVTSRHRTLVHAPIDQVYEALFGVDLYDSWPTQLLFALRGMPALFRRGGQHRKREPLTLDRVTRTGFIMLGQEEPREVVLGLVGQFWKLTGGLQMGLDSNGFLAFGAPGYAKAAWNFLLTDHPEGTLVETETRTYCTDPASLRRFRRYWAMIGPFSGLTRREILRLLRRRVG